MKKLLAAVAALCLATSAMAGTGTPPTPSNGMGLVDGSWLNGLAGGQNESYQYGIAAAGTTQATATQLPAGIALIQVDSGTGGFALPACLAGTELSVFNNSGATLTAYPSVKNNPVTGAQDTINSSTSMGSLTTAASYFFMCAKNGTWGAK